MDPEKREPMDKGFEDRETEHSVDDEVFSAPAVEDPKEEKTKEDEEPVE